MKILKYFTYFFLGLYILVCLVLYFAQDSIIFRPDRLADDFTFREGREVEIEVEKGVYLNCLLMPSENAKGVILYLHGNRGSNRRCLRQAEGFLNNGYNLFMPDYRGYGKSDGYIRSEKQLLADVQKVYDHLRNHYREDQIVLIGYSLGTGMASYLAAYNKPARLILIAPYVSFCDMKDRWSRLLPDFLVKYPLNNRKYLAQVQCPVTIFHGKQDEVVPFNSSEVLSQVSSGIDLIALDNTSHRRSIFNDLMRSRVGQLLAK